MSGLAIARSDAPLSKADEARQLIAEIRDDLRQGVEKFYRVGVKLKRIQDHELWKELGYKFFKELLKEELDMSEVHAYRLISAAELRPKLPDLPNGLVDGRNEWSERAVRELLRLETVRDQQRVAGKIRTYLVHNSKEKLTAKLVKKFVDEDMGPKPKKKLRPPKQGEGNLHIYLEQYARDIEAWQQRLQDVPQGGWDLLCEDLPQPIDDLIATLKSFASYLESTKANAKSASRPARR
jgi:hypothetical protein